MRYLRHLGIEGNDLVSSDGKKFHVFFQDSVHLFIVENKRAKKRGRR
jgi:hypothetical protein